MLKADRNVILKCKGHLIKSRFTDFTAPSTCDARNVKNRTFSHFFASSCKTDNLKLVEFFPSFIACIVDVKRFVVVFV